MELRSRIKENFSEEDLQFLEDLLYSPYFTNNNQKADVVKLRFQDRGFSELAPATNRYVMMKGKYVYKFALDTYAIKDNWNEFERTTELQPYLTKTYESNGLITIAEYVNLLTEQEFLDSKDNIVEILSYFFESGYIFMDMGIITKNFCNWGFRDDDQLVCIDYGYLRKADPKILFCPKCSGHLKYTTDWSEFYCIRCSKKYTVAEVMYRMDTASEGMKPSSQNSVVVIG